MSSFKHTVKLVDFSKFLKCFKSSIIMFYNQTKCLAFLYVLYVALVQYVYLHCCTDCMDNRPGVSAVRSLPVPQRLAHAAFTHCYYCLLYTSPSPRDRQKSRMPSSA